jgi:hypothetical protein
MLAATFVEGARVEIWTFTDMTGRVTADSTGRIEWGGHFGDWGQDGRFGNAGWNASRCEHPRCGASQNVASFALGRTERHRHRFTAAESGSVSEHMGDGHVSNVLPGYSGTQVPDGPNKGWWYLSQELRLFRLQCTSTTRQWRRGARGITFSTNSPGGT